ncbi:MAG: MFS transporter [Acidovorax sp.]
MATNTTPTTPTLSTPVLLLMAVACGICAGANYVNQPLLHSIARHLAVSDGTASLLVTMSQVSYALGLLLLVPLGDLLERRRLIVGLMVLAAIGMALAGSAHGFALLAAGTLMTGLFSVAAQVQIPMAATLAAPGQSGKAVGLLMSGLLTGILAARSVAGILSELGGWALVYQVVAATLLLLAAALWKVLPPSRNAAPPRYGEALRSMGALVARLPRLRTRALLGALSFGSTSVLFSTMALLLAGPPHHLGDAAIGLVGLAGVAGALMASVAGRLADRGMAQTTTAVSAAVMLASWGALWLGHASVAWFVFGMLIIDLALSGTHISNQNVIYALAPEARSRINAVYMTSYFIGAAAGSALGSAAWQWGGWAGACAVGSALAVLNACALWRDQRLVSAASHSS